MEGEEELVLSLIKKADKAYSTYQAQFEEYISKIIRQEETENQLKLLEPYLKK